jgi:DUF917 family protein
VGTLEWSRNKSESPRVLNDESHGHVDTPLYTTTKPKPHKSTADVMLDLDIDSYVPNVSRKSGEWFVSEVDLAFMAEGCAVLGTGGGGSSYTAYLNSVDVLRSAKEGRMRIVDPGAIKSESKVAVIGMVGAPSVSSERLLGTDDLLQASLALAKYMNISGFDAVMHAEIGGGNGMRGFTMATALDIPVVDADTMGRAFPKLDMSLPYVYGKSQPCPAVMSDARGNVQIIAGVEDHHRLERIIRSACQELGVSTAMSFNPLTHNDIQYCCHRGLSSAWFIGREIYLARAKKTDPATGVVSRHKRCFIVIALLLTRH